MAAHLEFPVFVVFYLLIDALCVVIGLTLGKKIKPVSHGEIVPCRVETSSLCLTTR